jgi:hypothetical protein
MRLLLLGAILLAGCGEVTEVMEVTSVRTAQIKTGSFDLTDEVATPVAVSDTQIVPVQIEEVEPEHLLEWKLHSIYCGSDDDCDALEMAGLTH